MYAEVPIFENQQPLVVASDYKLLVYTVLRNNTAYSARKALAQQLGESTLLL
jgi:hypothetical protein